jgi:drug/metabolite transporter (DMT)-like permease
MVLFCSMAYAVHMLILGRSDETYDTVVMTFVQLVIVMIVCACLSIATQEHAAVPATGTLWGAIVICGVLASAIAFAIQTWAQQVMMPARVALILVMEPAFGGLFGWFVAGHVVAHEAIGAALMLGGMVLSELWAARHVEAEPALEGPAILVEE